MADSHARRSSPSSALDFAIVDVVQVPSSSKDFLSPQMFIFVLTRLKLPTMFTVSRWSVNQNHQIFMYAFLALIFQHVQALSR